MRIFAALVLATVACGGSTDGSQNPGQTACTASLSGAVTASNVTCFAAAGLDANGDGNGAVGFTFTGLTGMQVTAAVNTVGTPTTRTYANTDSGAKGGCLVTQISNNQEWVAVKSGSSGDQGTYSMTVSSLGNQVNNPDGGPGNVFLSVHGTVNCTMPAITVTGASGTVTLNATF
jgi:hypothetical protein